MLSRELAHRNHYPAIDVLQSVSRLAGDLLASEVRDAAGALRESLAVYRDNEDLITLGAYQLGTDAARRRRDRAPARDHAFLRQGIDEPAHADDSDRALLELMTPAPPAFVEQA